MSRIVERVKDMNNQCTATPDYQKLVQSLSGHTRDNPLQLDPGSYRLPDFIIEVGPTPVAVFQDSNNNIQFYGPVTVTPQGQWAHDPVDCHGSSYNTFGASLCHPIVNCAPNRPFFYGDLILFQSPPSSTQHFIKFDRDGLIQEESFFNFNGELTHPHEKINADIIDIKGKDLSFSSFSGDAVATLDRISGKRVYYHPWGITPQLGYVGNRDMIGVYAGASIFYSLEDTANSASPRRPTLFASLTWNSPFAFNPGGPYVPPSAQIDVGVASSPSEAIALSLFGRKPLGAGGEVGINIHFADFLTLGVSEACQSNQPCTPMIGVRLGADWVFKVFFDESKMLRFLHRSVRNGDDDIHSPKEIGTQNIYSPQALATPQATQTPPSTTGRSFSVPLSATPYILPKALAKTPTADLNATLSAALDNSAIRTADFFTTLGITAENWDDLKNRIPRGLVDRIVTIACEIATPLSSGGTPFATEDFLRPIVTYQKNGVIYCIQQGHFSLEAKEPYYSTFTPSDDGVWTKVSNQGQTVYNKLLISLKANVDDAIDRGRLSSSGTYYGISKP